MKRRLERRQRDGSWVTKAEVELHDDDSVTIDYGPRTDDLRVEWEEIGIVDYDRVVRASDGRPFFDALLRAYATSSFARVVDA